MTLTLRQTQIVSGLCDGKQAKQIAHERNLSVSTVRWHIREIATHLPREYRMIPPTRAIVRWAFRSGKWGK